ncbi:MAG: hypothetical protein M1826_001618 [Phylliscum demangeonii]|nr:MAG: hypothetical protein M1826_001618 [Phylliscum demangeonii]
MGWSDMSESEPERSGDPPSFKFQPYSPKPRQGDLRCAPIDLTDVDELDEEAGEELVTWICRFLIELHHKLADGGKGWRSIRDLVLTQDENATVAVTGPTASTEGSAQAQAAQIWVGLPRSSQPFGHPAAIDARASSPRKLGTQSSPTADVPEEPTSTSSSSDDEEETGEDEQAPTSTSSSEDEESEQEPETGTDEQTADIKSTTTMEQTFSSPTAVFPKEPTPASSSSDEESEQEAETGEDEPTADMENKTGVTQTSSSPSPVRRANSVTRASCQTPALVSSHDQASSMVRASSQSAPPSPAPTLPAPTTHTPTPPALTSPPARSFPAVDPVGEKGEGPEQSDDHQDGSLSEDETMTDAGPARSVDDQKRRLERLGTRLSQDLQNWRSTIDDNDPLHLLLDPGAQSKVPAALQRMSATTMVSFMQLVQVNFTRALFHKRLAQMHVAAWPQAKDDELALRMSGPKTRKRKVVDSLVQAERVPEYQRLLSRRRWLRHIRAGERWQELSDSVGLGILLLDHHELRVTLMGQLSGAWFADFSRRVKADRDLMELVDLATQTLRSFHADAAEAPRPAPILLLKAKAPQPAKVDPAWREMAKLDLFLKELFERKYE